MDETMYDNDNTGRLVDPGVDEQLLTKLNKLVIEENTGHNLENNIEQIQTGRILGDSEENVHNIHMPNIQENGKKLISRDQYLEKHVAVNHPIETYLESTLKSKFLKHKMYFKIYVGDNYFKCSVCKKCFSENIDIKNHVKIHARVQTVKGVYLKNPVGDKRFKCNVCKTCFSQKIDIKNHIKTHTRVQTFKFMYVRGCKENKFFKCNICKKCLFRNKSIKNQFEMFTRVKPYKCVICRRVFDLNEEN